MGYNMKKQITFFIEEKTREKFSQKYSLNMSKFLRNCVILAINDSAFFKDILFLNEINNKPEKCDIKVQQSIF